MKTQDLIGAQLDWAVAKADENLYPKGNVLILDGKVFTIEGGDWETPDRWRKYSPTDSWHLAGPIIEQEGINLTMFVEGEVDPEDVGSWCAAYDRDNFGDDEKSCTASTPLIAAMRVYAMAKLGSEINIPEELAP